MPRRGAARRRGRAARRSRSGARSSSATGCCRTRSSASPGRTGRRRRPSCSARSSARRPRGNVGRALGATLDGEVAPGALDRLRALELPARGRRTSSGRASPCCSTSSPTTSTGTARFEAYRDAKLRIFENQGADDVAVVPRGFGRCPGEARRVEFAADDALPAEPRIPGAHNRENAAAATAAARAAGHRRRRDRRGAARRSRASRTGSSSSREVDGVRYVNDSKATNTAAARRALAAYDAPLHADPRRLAQGRGLRAARRARSGRTCAARYLIGETRRRARRRARPRRRPLRARGDLADGRRGRGRGAEPGRRRPALARLRELRPVPRLRGARRGVPAARAEPVRVKRGQLESHVLVLVTLGLVAFGLVMVYSATSASAALGGRRPGLLPQAAGDLRAARARRCWSSPRASTTGALRTLAPPLLVVEPRACCVAVLVVGQRGQRRPPLARRSGRATFQPSELAKLALAVWAAALPRAPPRRRRRSASSGGRSALVDGRLLRPDPGRARPRHGDRDRA